VVSAHKENLRKNWLQSGEKNKKIKAISRGDTESKDVFNSEGYLASILFLGGQLLTAIIETWIGFPHCNHDVNAERIERAEKRYKLARGRTRARIEVTENVESLWKAVFLLLKSTSVSQLLRQKKGKSKQREWGGIFFRSVGHSCYPRWRNRTENC